MAQYGWSGDVVCAAELEYLHPYSRVIPSRVLLESLLLEMLEHKACNNQGPVSPRQGAKLFAELAHHLPPKLVTQPMQLRQSMDRSHKDWRPIP
eukprot:20025-Eustigmatos_ZCMA.PRE.1